MSNWNIPEDSEDVLCLDDAPADGMRVGVMEDNDSHADDIRRMLESRGLIYVPVANSERAVFLAEVEHVIGFILDVNMGEGREQEGIDALEDLKSLDRRSFVIVYTANPDLVEKSIRAGADYAVEKRWGATSDLAKPIGEYLQEFGLGHDTPSLPDEPELDPNFREYCTLLLQRYWREKYLGMYVGFVDGAFIAANVDRRVLIEELRSVYPRRQKFVTIVESPDIDIPSPLEFR